MLENLSMSSTDMILTTDQSLLKNKDYQTVKEVIEPLINSGIITLGAKYCISLSELISSTLKLRGIECRLIECQVTMTDFKTEPPSLGFIGFENITNAGELSTHVVVITMTDVPMLIDAAISHRLPGSKPVLIDRANTEVSEKRILGEFELSHDRLKILYVEKKNQMVPSIYHNSFLYRAKTDKTIFENLKLLKTVVIIALVISSINAARGIYDFYLKYYDDTAPIGYSANLEIINRLERLEHLFKNKK